MATLSIPLSFNFATHLCRCFASTLHALYYTNYILVLKVIPCIIFQISKKLENCTQMYAYTGGALPSITLSFIFATDSWHTFALTSHIILHQNYVLVLEVTPGIISVIFLITFKISHSFMARFRSSFSCQVSISFFKLA